MKAPTPLLVASFVLNALLLASFALPGKPDSPPSSASPLSGVSAAGGLASAKSLSATWSRLEPGNPAILLARLRGAGFPAKIANAVATAEIRAQFDLRRKALDLTIHDRPFWEANIQDPAPADALNAIAKEEDRTIKDLVGSDFYRDEDYEGALRRRFPGLAPEKIEQLENLRAKYSQQLDEFYATHPSTGSFTDVMSKREQAKAEFDRAERAERASLLTSEELRNYDLRMSDTARTLRNSLAGFDATEAEFQSLYDLQTAFRDRVGSSSSVTPEEWKQAQEKLGQQIQAALGPERYADYQRSMNQDYVQTSRLVTRLDLPAETANQVWALEQEVKPRMTRLRADIEVPSAHRAQQLAAMADETKARLTTLLGNRGLAAYQQYGGSWMQGFRLPAAKP